MVNKTNLPRRGTTRLVGGIISARRRKNTVRESRIDIARLTYFRKHFTFIILFIYNYKTGIEKYLFAGIGRKVEDENGQESDPDTGDNEIHRVKESLPAHCDVESDVQVRLNCVSKDYGLYIWTTRHLEERDSQENSFYIFYIFIDSL